MHAAWYICVALHALLFARIYIGGLVRTYPFLTLYLGVSVLRSLSLMPMSYSGKAYLIAWMLSEPVLWVTQAGVVGEIYVHLCRHYPGMERIARNLLAVILLVAAAAAAIPLFYERRYVAPPGTERIVAMKLAMFVATRFVATGSAVAVACMAGFYLLHREQPVKRNLKVYAAACATLFVVDAAQFLVGTMISVRLAGPVFISLTIFALVFWIGFFNRRGEFLAPVVADLELRTIADQISTDTLRALGQFPAERRQAYHSD